MSDRFPPHMHEEQRDVFTCAGCDYECNQGEDYATGLVLPRLCKRCERAECCAECDVCESCSEEIDNEDARAGREIST